MVLKPRARLTCRACRDGRAGFAVGALVKAHHHQRRRPQRPCPHHGTSLGAQTHLRRPLLTPAARSSPLSLRGIGPKALVSGGGGAVRTRRQKEWFRIQPQPWRPRPGAALAVRYHRRESLECSAGRSARVCAGVYADGGRRRGQRRLLASTRRALRLTGPLDTTGSGGGSRRRQRCAPARALAKRAQPW
jgi:hypothetical protein